MLKACCHSLCKYSWLYSYYPSFFFLFYFMGLNIDSWMFGILSYCFAIAIFFCVPLSLYLSFSLFQLT